MNDQVIIAIAGAIKANAEAITALINSVPKEMQDAVNAQVAAPAAVPVAAPVDPVPAPMAAPVPAPVVEAPAAPFVQSPVAAPSVQLPFSDPKSLLEWVMATYQELGPEKGMKIQDVLNSMGCPAISDVTPDKYAQFYAAVEAIK